jgi:hypothetical protein
MLYLFSSFDGIIINITTDILNESYSGTTLVRLGQPVIFSFIPQNWQNTSSTIPKRDKIRFAMTNKMLSPEWYFSDLTLSGLIPPRVYTVGVFLAING